MGKTLFDKVWDAHVVKRIKNGPDVLFIDRHLVHEVTSPVAFLGLQNRKLDVLFPDKTFATADHNTPTKNQNLPIKDPLSAKQLQTLKLNSKKHKIPFWGLGHKKNGIVHVIGPENGITLPGATIVCGDSHTSTHGAFGAIAFGIGTSEVEMVLTTQCVLQPKPKKMRIIINGKLNNYVTPKDVALYIISKISTSGATGHFVEYSGDVFEAMSMEGRMTVCNLSIEMGARGGMIAPDKKTINYIRDREFTPKGDVFLKLLKYWNSLKTEKDATFDREYVFEGDKIEPMITYGTNPGMGTSISDGIPYSKDLNVNKKTFLKSLNYMNYSEGDNLIGKKIDYVFLGSCTNGRIEDLREAAKILKDKKISSHVNAMVVPGSGLVKEQAEQEGLDKIFISSGFEWREPGCSMCLAMNADKLKPEERCASTSNRNFEGRQGRGGRTHLVSPGMAAAAAISGNLDDVRKYQN